MDPCCRCRRVCGLVMFLVGIASISATCFLLYHTVTTLESSGNVCILWLDMAGRLSLSAIGFYVTGLCGCIPLPDIFRPKWFPEPFFVWKSWRRCSRYHKNCARVFRICASRTRTSSRTPLLEDQDSYSPGLSQWENPRPMISPSCASRTRTSSRTPLLEDQDSYSPGLSQWENPRPMISPSCASSRPDSNSETSEREVSPRSWHSDPRIFHFDDSLFTDSSDSAESFEDDEHSKNNKRRPIRKGHPLVPWKLLGLHKTVRRWGSDPSTINKAFHHTIRRLNIKNRVRCNTVPVHGELYPTRAEGIKKPLDSKGPWEKRTSPKTNSKRDTSGGSATGNGDLGSMIEPELFAHFPDSKDIRCSSIKPNSSKIPSKLDKREDAATSHRDLMRQELERFPDTSHLKDICCAREKSISPKNPSKQDTSEGAATGVRRDV